MKLIRSEPYENSDYEKWNLWQVWLMTSVTYVKCDYESETNENRIMRTEIMTNVTEPVTWRIWPSWLEFNFPTEFFPPKIIIPGKDEPETGIPIKWRKFPPEAGISGNFSGGKSIKLFKNRFNTTDQTSGQWPLFSNTIEKNKKNNICLGIESINYTVGRHWNKGLINNI